MLVTDTSHLRMNLKDYIASVSEDDETIIINCGSGKAVVMIPLEEYNSLKESSQKSAATESSIVAEDEEMKQYDPGFELNLNPL